MNTPTVQNDNEHKSSQREAGTSQTVQGYIIRCAGDGSFLSEAGAKKKGDTYRKALSRALVVDEFMAKGLGASLTEGAMYQMIPLLKEIGYAYPTSIIASELKMDGAFYVSLVAPIAVCNGKPNQVCVLKGFATEKEAIAYGNTLAEKWEHAPYEVERFELFAQTCGHLVYRLTEISAQHSTQPEIAEEKMRALWSAEVLTNSRNRAAYDAFPVARYDYPVTNDEDVCSGMAFFLVGWELFAGARYKVSNEIDWPSVGPVSNFDEPIGSAKLSQIFTHLPNPPAALPPNDVEVGKFDSDKFFDGLQSARPEVFGMEHGAGTFYFQLGRNTVYATPNYEKDGEVPCQLIEPHGDVIASTVRSLPITNTLADIEGYLVIVDELKALWADPVGRCGNCDKTFYAHSEDLRQPQTQNPKFLGHCDNCNRLVYPIINRKVVKDARVVRIYIDGGVVQAIEGIPTDVVVRTIDTDVEGSEDDETVKLEGEDKKLANDAERAFVCDWYADGSNRSLSDDPANEIVREKKGGAR